MLLFNLYERLVNVVNIFHEISDNYCYMSNSYIVKPCHVSLWPIFVFINNKPETKLTGKTCKTIFDAGCYTVSKFEFNRCIIF